VSRTVQGSTRPSLLGTNLPERRFAPVSVRSLPPSIRNFGFQPTVPGRVYLADTSVVTDAPQFCCRFRGTKVYWLCRVRCCNKCLDTKYAPTRLICSGSIHVFQFQVVRWTQFPRLLRSLCPVRSRGERSASSFLSAGDSQSLTERSRVSVSP